MTTAVTTPRMVGPDLARGMTLLGIALANSVTAWAVTTTMEGTAGIIRPGNVWDQIAVMFSTIAVHVRGLPMFATLLGYGVGLIYARCAQRGMTYREAQKTIFRRYAFLGLFGALHMVFLFWGDIMLVYAMMVMILIFLLKLSDKALLITAGIVAVIGLPFSFFSVYIAGGVGAGRFTEQSPFGALDTYLDQLFLGSIGALFSPLSVFVAPMVLPVIIIGFVAGRRNILVNPAQFRMPMVAAMVVAVVIALGVGIPWGLSALGIIGGEIFWMALNNAVGFFTGPGTVALFFFLGDKLAGTRWVTLPPLSWVIALGRMSMTGYVLQSVVFMIVMRPWGLGIGSDGPVTQVLAVAVLVWFITVLFAAAWPRERGPLEALHRKLSYPEKAQQIPAAFPAQGSALPQSNTPVPPPVASAQEHEKTD